MVFYNGTQMNADYTDIKFLLRQKSINIIKICVNLCKSVFYYSRNKTITANQFADFSNSLKDIIYI